MCDKLTINTKQFRVPIFSMHCTAHLQCEVFFLQICFFEFEFCSRIYLILQVSQLTINKMIIDHVLCRIFDSFKKTVATPLCRNIENDKIILQMKYIPHLQYFSEWCFWLSSLQNLFDNLHKSWKWFETCLIHFECKHSLIIIKRFFWLILKRHFFYYF